MKTPVLLPQPRVLNIEETTFTLPSTVIIAIADAADWDAVHRLCDCFRDHSVHLDLPDVPAHITLRRNPEIPPQGYRIKITPENILIEAEGTGLHNAVTTLRQWLSQAHENTVPCCFIDDAPDFQLRGVYYDIARGRVPKLKQLMILVDGLAAAKINHLQLYIEHTFAFCKHPKIGENASPLQPQDILILDAHCAARGIELVPSLATFGHLSPVLKHPEYNALAEDLGVGQYVDPDAQEKKKWLTAKAWTLSPANPDIYPFLDSLFKEFLPLFRSKQFNICCDETMDLGLGQSYQLCQELGKGRVYLNHILKLRELAAKYGKTIMFWGDIISNYPELIPEIPKDVMLLDWGYGWNHDTNSVQKFADAQLPLSVCPGTSSWISLFPRMIHSEVNIHNFAQAGKDVGAFGMLNTDWGDGGHYNFLEFSWPGYWFGAEQAWNTNAHRKTFIERFCKLFIKSENPRLPAMLKHLGQLASITSDGFYGQYWRHLLFADASSWPRLTGEINADYCVAGKFTQGALVANRKFGSDTLRELGQIRAIFEQVEKEKGADPAGVLPYWIFAVDTIACAARRLALLGPGDDPVAPDEQTRRVQKILAELRELRRRFTVLWHGRSRPSELNISLEYYDNAIAFLETQLS